MTDFCNLTGCDQPVLPPTFWRDPTIPFASGRSGKAKGGLGLCETHDAQMTALVRHRRQVSKLYNSQPDPSLVYFIRCNRPDDLIKIGSTDALESRRLQIGGRVVLLEPGGRAHEGRLHAKFWHLWVTGEWYRPGPDLLNYIDNWRAT